MPSDPHEKPRNCMTCAHRGHKLRPRVGAGLGNVWNEVISCCRRYPRSPNPTVSEHTICDGWEVVPELRRIGEKEVPDAK